MSEAKQYYIGWDVGAWYCTTSGESKKSKDAIVILDDTNVLGTWSTNLKDIISTSKTSSEFINELFTLCQIKNHPLSKDEIILAIDAPLTFSKALKDLINGDGIIEQICDYPKNQYLFRATEMFLFENGITPLSSINHMIGSQTTKAMHTVAKYTTELISCGVWANKKYLTIIETYPAACKSLKFNKELEYKNTDLEDAKICAEIAKLFHKQNELLELPCKSVSEEEGWIWVPKEDILNAKNSKKIKDIKRKKN